MSFYLFVLLFSYKQNEIMKIFKNISSLFSPNSIHKTVTAIMSSVYLIPFLATLPFEFTFSYAATVIAASTIAVLSSYFLAPLVVAVFSFVHVFVSLVCIDKRQVG